MAGKKQFAQTSRAGIALLLMAAAGGHASMALAQTPPASAEPAPTDVEQLRAEVSELRARETQANARAAALEERLRQLEQMFGGAPDPAKLDDMRGRGAAVPRFEMTGDGLSPPMPRFTALQPPPPASASAPASGPPSDEEEPDRKAPAPTEAVEDVTRKEQGYFGSRLTLEPGLSYSHFDDARINLSGFLALDAIFLGRISIDDVSADILTGDVTARYGLSDRIQLDANLPFIYRRSKFSSGGAGGNTEGISEKTLDGRGLADASIGASVRLFKETPSTPDFVINARIKAPTGRSPWGVEVVEVPGSQGNLVVPERLSTGSGAWGGSFGFSALKTLDPMVVFGSFNYFHNFTKKFGDIDEAEGDQPGKVSLGRAVQFGLGVAFALNEKSSLNFSYSQRFVTQTSLQREGGLRRKVAGSDANVALFNMGATFAINDRLTLITSLGIGLTDDAPNMVFSIRLPFRF